MILVGRALSVIGIVAFAVTMSLSLAGPRGVVNSVLGAFGFVNALGALGAISVFGAWGLGLYHWGTRFTGSASSRRRWGVGLTLGAFVGAWIYWLGRRAIAESNGGK